MTSVHLIRLVAAREIRERWRARSFKVSLLISVLVVAGAIAGPKTIGSNHGPLRVGVVGPFTDTARRGTIALRSVVGRPITLVAESDEAAAEAAVRTKHLVALISNGAVTVREEPHPGDTGITARLANGLAGVVGQDAALHAAGLSDDQISGVQTAPSAPVRGLVANRSARNHQRSTTIVGIILIYTFVAQYGAWVLFGVVQEKTSRVVEILLATLQPIQLLSGKVLGIGTLAVFQGAVVAAAAFASATVTGSHVLQGSAGLTVIEMTGWFVLGYAFYATIYGAAGALVGRQEEVQNVAFPIGLPLLVAYLAGFSSLLGQVSPFTKVLSFLPPTAPIAMPVRLAAGPVPAWQVLASVALLVAGIVLAMRVGALVYNRAILQTGSRMTWRQVLRSADR